MTNRTSAPVGWYRGVSEGDVPPEKWRKMLILKPIRAIWCILFAYHKAPTQTQAPYLFKK